MGRLSLKGNTVNRLSVFGELFQLSQRNRQNEPRTFDSCNCSCSCTSNNSCAPEGETVLQLVQTYNASHNNHRIWRNRSIWSGNSGSGGSTSSLNLPFPFSIF